MIALLFTAEPKTAEDFIREVEEYEADEELREQQRYEELRRYVYGLSKAELQRLYLDALIPTRVGGRWILVMRREDNVLIFQDTKDVIEE